MGRVVARATQEAATVDSGPIAPRRSPIAVQEDGREPSDTCLAVIRNDPATAGKIAPLTAQAEALCLRGEGSPRR